MRSTIALPPAALEAAMLCCVGQVADWSSRSCKDSPDEAGRLSARLARCLVSPVEQEVAADNDSAPSRPQYGFQVGHATCFLPSSMELSLVGLPAVKAAAELIAAAFRGLRAWQLEAGPMASVVSGDLQIVLIEPRETIFAASDTVEVATDNVIAEASSEGVWHRVFVDCGAAALMGAVACVQPFVEALELELTDLLQLPQVLVSSLLDATPTGLDGTNASREQAIAVLIIEREVIEAWVRDQCVAAWNGDDAKLAQERRQATRRAAEEAEAREAAQVAAEAAATALRARRDGTWARANERLSAARERKRLNERSAMAVAIDGMVERVASELGVQLNERGEVVGEADVPATETALALSPELSLKAASALPRPAAAAAPPHNAGVGCLPGIGPKRAEKLREAKLGTLGSLAAAKPDDLVRAARLHGLPLKSLNSWAEAARLHLQQ